MTEANDYSGPLFGIKGWLLLYLVGPMGLNCFWLVTSIRQFFDNGLAWFFSALLLLNVIGLFSMFAEKSWVRIYHIAYTTILGALLLVTGVLVPSFPGVIFGVAALLWAGYWFKSRRVAKTYHTVDAAERAT